MWMAQSRRRLSFVTKEAEERQGNTWHCALCNGRSAKVSTPQTWKDERAQLFARSLCLSSDQTVCQEISWSWHVWQSLVGQLTETILPLIGTVRRTLMQFSTVLPLSSGDVSVERDVVPCAVAVKRTGISARWDVNASIVWTLLHLSP